jgi:hypothetical protein
MLPCPVHPRTSPVRFPHSAFHRAPRPSHHPPRRVTPRRSQARSPHSHPISGASQFTDVKSEITSGRHQVTEPHRRFRPSGPVAQFRTAVSTRSAVGSQNRTHRRPMASRVSDFRLADRPSPITGAALRTGPRPTKSSGAERRPTPRPIASVSTERCPTLFSRQPPVQNGARPFGRIRTPVPNRVRLPDEFGRRYTTAYGPPDKFRRQYRTAYGPPDKFRREYKTSSARPPDSFPQ